MYRTFHIVKEQCRRQLKRSAGRRRQADTASHPRHGRAVTDALRYRIDGLHGMETKQVTRGGARRVRTADPRLAKPMLSQLSYGPTAWWVWVDSNHRLPRYQGCALTA